VHTPSTRPLKDGRTVSCVMPYVRHIDHTEHDIKCVVTEHGYALNMDIRPPKRRAVDIIERCAHPHFRPLLHAYLDMAGAGDEPRPTDMAGLRRGLPQLPKGLIKRDRKDPDPVSPRK
jgi:acyl-CoA hydrolase